MGDPLHVNDSNFDSEVIQSEIPVLVDFWAPWCGPCRAIAPHVESLATEYAGRAKVVKVNTDESQQTAIAFGIRSIPALLVFKGGQVVDQKVGAQPKAGIKAMLDRAL